MEVPFRRAMVMQVMQLHLWSALQTSCHSLKTSGLQARQLSSQRFSWAALAGLCQPLSCKGSESFGLPREDFL